MRRQLLAGAVACCLLAATVAGCGSSESSSGTSSTATTATKTSSTSGPSSSSSSSSSGGLKADTTPKFASPSSSEPVHSGTVRIVYRNIAIDPDAVRVKAGSTLKWVNEDSQRCNVSSVGGAYTFKSPDFGEGGSFELHVPKAGTIHYECTYFPATMNGTVEVVE